MRKLLQSVLASALLLTAAPTFAQDKPQTGGTLRVAIEAWPLYRLLPNNNNWTPFFINQFESLIRADDKGNYHPWLAKSWKVSDDRKVYTFQLRDDVEFQDGDKSNATAVKTTFHALFDGGITLTPPRNAYAGNVQAVNVLGEHTLEIRLSKPDRVFFNMLSSLATAIISPSSIKSPNIKAGGVELKGTGSFELVEVVPDQKIVYRKFAKYNWAPPNALHQGPAPCSMWSQIRPSGPVC